MAYYLALISNEKKGAVATLLRTLLWLLSLFYGLGVALRARFHKQSYRPTIETISVGNLVAGGAGKTPFCIYLAQQLAHKGPVAVVVRGYKAQAEKMDLPTLVHKDSSPELVGDEALIICRHLPNAIVISCKSKVEGVKLAEKQGARCVIVDDAMQHLALKRDQEIVLIDSQNPFGYGHLLPRGLLREPISGLKRATCVVITCRNGQNASVSLQEQIKALTDAPQITLHYKPAGLYDLNDTPITLPQGSKVALFSTIANPQQFIATVTSLGFNIVTQTSFGDHEPIPPKTLQKLTKNAQERGAEALICTEKERVKLKSNITGLDIYWLKLAVEDGGS